MADEPQVLVPVPGRVLPLPEVPDPVFAGRWSAPAWPWTRRGDRCGRSLPSTSWPPMSAANVDEGCFAFDGLPGVRRRNG
jgi:hypothetical protein